MASDGDTLACACAKMWGKLSSKGNSRGVVVLHRMVSKNLGGDGHAHEEENLERAGCCWIRERYILARDQQKKAGGLTCV
jgi:hypothetical protein